MFEVINPTLLTAFRFTSGSSLLNNFTLWENSNQSSLLQMSGKCPPDHTCTFPIDQPLKLYPGFIYTLSYGIVTQEPIYFVVLFNPLSLPLTADNGAWVMVDCTFSNTSGTYPAKPCTPQNGRISSFYPIEPVICSN